VSGFSASYKGAILALIHSESDNSESGPEAYRRLNIAHPHLAKLRIATTGRELMPNTW
jgi:hypothetical protein